MPTPRIKITSCEATTRLSNLYRIYTEDGEALVADFLVAATTVDGSTFIHDTMFDQGYGYHAEEGTCHVRRRSQHLQDYAAKVLAHGSINPDYWTKVEPESLEDREAYNLRCEEEERAGW